MSIYIIYFCIIYCAVPICTSAMLIDNSAASFTLLHSRRKQKTVFFGGGGANKNLPKYLEFNFQIPRKNWKIWSLCSRFGKIQGFREIPGEASMYLRKIPSPKPGLNCQRECPNDFKFT